MSGHTKGPWTWRESGDHFNVSDAVGVVAVAFGTERTSNGGVTGVIGDEGEWNARLIAAAPDLLAAAEAAFAQCMESPEKEVLRAAIAKARGGA